MSEIQKIRNIVSIASIIISLQYEENLDFVSIEDVYEKRLKDTRYTIDDIKQTWEYLVKSCVYVQKVHDDNTIDLCYILKYSPQ